MQTGRAEVVGPLSKEEREENEFYKKMLSNARDNLTDYQTRLEETEDTEEMSWIQDDIAHCEKIIPLLENIVFDDDDDLAPYERAKKEGYYDAFMEGPEALAEHFREKYKLGEFSEDDKS